MEITNKLKYYFDYEDKNIGIIRCLEECQIRNSIKIGSSSCSYCRYFNDANFDEKWIICSRISETTCIKK